MCSWGEGYNVTWHGVESKGAGEVGTEVRWKLGEGTTIGEVWG